MASIYRGFVRGLVRKRVDDSIAVTGPATTSTKYLGGVENVSGLCSQCWNMMVNEEDMLDLLSGSPMSLRSKAEVWASAKAGCPICKVIKTKAHQIEKDDENPVKCKDLSFVPVTENGGLDHFRVEANRSASSPTIVAHIDIYTNDGRFYTPHLCPSSYH